MASSMLFCVQTTNAGGNESCVMDDDKEEKNWGYSSLLVLLQGVGGNIRHTGTSSYLIEIPNILNFENWAKKINKSSKMRIY